MLFFKYSLKIKTILGIKLDSIKGKSPFMAGPIAGLVVGTLMGTLLALGVSESKVQEYAEAIESGKIILYVEAMDNTDIEKRWAEIKNEGITH